MTHLFQDSPHKMVPVNPPQKKQISDGAPRKLVDQVSRIGSDEITSVSHHLLAPCQGWRHFQRSAAARRCFLHEQLEVKNSAEEMKKCPTTVSRWWFQTCLIFTPKLGEDSRFHGHIFQLPLDFFKGKDRINLQAANCSRGFLLCIFGRVDFGISQC